MNDTQTDQRIAVYLLTGYLGSGKTSLLISWLTSPELKDAALVINELGEVGLDHQLLSSASESSASLVANACVCCTGLPGLTQSLEDLFWARLERRMPRFPAVVIETTGLAEPGPVIEALKASDLLQERYRIAGVITCLSASTADQILRHCPEARAQLEGADVLVITKTDLVTVSELHALQQKIHHQLTPHESFAAPSTKIATSSHQSFKAQDMLAALHRPHGPWDQLADYMHTDTVTSETVHQHEISHHGSHQNGQVHAHHHGGTGHHHHAAQAYFWSVPETVNPEHLLKNIAALQACLAEKLLRIKGLVTTLEGLRLIQLTPFESIPSITPTEVPKVEQGKEQPKGLTVIASLPLSLEQEVFLKQLLAP